jgi:uncharacterized protein (TIGR00725 family)
MERMKSARIGIIGAGDCTSEGYEAAFEIGKRVAERGAILVCGGLGGVMEAGAKGAVEAGGLTVGILPGVSADEANAFIRIPLPTGMGHARNALVVRASNVLIAVEGGYGTLSEIALALKMGKPVIGWSTWKGVPGVQYESTPMDAVEAAFRLLKK